MKTAVYRFFDKSGTLLYVGSTKDPETRFAHHARDKKWWGDVVHQTIEWYPVREEALAVEKSAIRNESPVHNKVYNGLADGKLLQVQISADLHLWLKMQAIVRDTTITAIVTEALERIYPEPEGDFCSCADPDCKGDHR